jgi:hypothetical protein
VKPTPWLASAQHQQCVRIERGTAADILRTWRRLRTVTRRANPVMRTYATSTFDRGVLLVPTHKGQEAIRIVG